MMKMFINVHFDDDDDDSDDDDYYDDIVSYQRLLI